jgi:hypothetical protein
MKVCGTNMEEQWTLTTMRRVYATNNRFPTKETGNREILPEFDVIQ